MKNYRAKYPEYDFNFFQNMTNLHDYIIEWVEEQTTTKLDTSKNTQYDMIRQKLIKETGRKSWESRLIHIFHDNVWDVEQDDQAELTWTSQIHQLGSNPYTGEKIPASRFLRLDGNYLPLDQMTLKYRVDISVKRYCQGEEISEFDLSNGMVYLDVLENRKEFYFLSEIDE